MQQGLKNFADLTKIWEYVSVHQGDEQKQMPLYRTVHNLFRRERIYKHPIHTIEALEDKRPLTALQVGLLEQRSFQTLHDLVTEAWDLALHDILRYSVVVHYLRAGQTAASHARLVLAPGEHRRLADALANLISNGARYSNPHLAPAERRIEINILRLADGALIVFVEDNGIGVLPENLPTLGTPRFREGRKDLQESHGFGLTDVIATLHDHGYGPLWIKSTPDEGLAAAFLIPATKLGWFHSRSLERIEAPLPYDAATARHVLAERGFIIPDAAQSLVDTSR